MQFYKNVLNIKEKSRHMNVYINVILGYFAAIFVSFARGASVKTALYASLISALSYFVFLVVPHDKSAYFISTAVLMLLCEIFARILKKPAIIFLVIGIYPLVPGSGLYQTFLEIFNRNYSSALKVGGDTLVNLTIMAVSIAFVSTCFKILKDFKNLHKA